MEDPPRDTEAAKPEEAGPSTFHDLGSAAADPRLFLSHNHSLGSRRTSLEAGGKAAAKKPSLPAASANDDWLGNAGSGHIYQVIWTKRGGKLALAVLLCYTVLIGVARLVKKQPASVEFDATIFILLGMCIWGICSPLLANSCPRVTKRSYVNFQVCTILTIVCACEIWKNTHLLFGESAPTTDRFFMQAALGMLVPCTGAILLLPPMPLTLGLMVANVVPYGLSPHTDWDFVWSYSISQVTHHTHT